MKTNYKDSACRLAITGDDPHADHRLGVTVVVTTTEGTRAALRAAGALARNLSARVEVVAVETVPYRLDLGQPMVPIDVRRRHLLAVISHLECDADEVSIQVCLGRDRKQCLRQILAPRSLVVIGGTRHWWSREKKLEQCLGQLGHQVFFVDVNRS